MMRGCKVAITGVGETPFLRKSEHGVLQMMARSSLAAIADAGLSAADIDGYICNDYAGYGSDEIAHAIGAGERRFCAIADSAGGTATSGQALVLAQLAIEAGLARHVLVPYAIQSTKPGGVYSTHAREPQKAALEMPTGFFGQPSYFATMANRYAHEFGRCCQSNRNSSPLRAVRAGEAMPQAASALHSASAAERRSR